ncbi:MAG TPA: hypothetical protein VKT75_00995, partial [Acidobacteriaceae bacterium]|nr:hypothetical protein [Acidobacteriaceae bacterium]
MAGRDKGAAIEAALTLGMLLLVLFPVWGLVYAAKMRAAPPADALMVNEATAPQFAKALEIDPEIAQRLVDWRGRHHGFESVDSLLDVPLFNEDEAARVTAVATAGHVDLRTATPRIAASALAISPPIAHRLTAYRDSLLPSPFEGPGAGGQAPARPGNGRPGPGAVDGGRMPGAGGQQGGAGGAAPAGTGAGGRQGGA